uniref:Uncharacterized protein n=1 Tax=Anopheles atroparvus TaxID=41427 RepID=A0A182IKS9_ANOAO
MELSSECGCAELERSLLIGSMSKGEVNPRDKPVDPGVNAGKLGLRTAEAPRDDARDHEAVRILVEHMQRSPTVALAGVLTTLGNAGAHHALIDLEPEVLRLVVALGVAKDRHVHFLQPHRKRTITRLAPARHDTLQRTEDAGRSVPYTVVKCCLPVRPDLITGVGVAFWWQTHRYDGFSQRNRFAQLQQCDVVRDEEQHVEEPVGHDVGHLPLEGVLLGHGAIVQQELHPEARPIAAEHAVRRRQDVAVVDQRASADEATAVGQLAPTDHGAVMTGEETPQYRQAHRDEADPDLDGLLQFRQRDVVVERVQAEPLVAVQLRDRPGNHLGAIDVIQLRQQLVRRDTEQAVRRRQDVAVVNQRTAAIERAPGNSGKKKHKFGFNTECSMPAICTLGGGSYTHGDHQSTVR